MVPLLIHVTNTIVAIMLAQSVKMITGVADAAFAQWNDKIIITGGTSNEGVIPQVQVVDETMTWILPDMQENIVGHCMVETVPNTYIIIGGGNGVSNSNNLYDKTFIITPTNDSKISVSLYVSSFHHDSF